MIFKTKTAVSRQLLMLLLLTVSFGITTIMLAEPATAVTCCLTDSSCAEDEYCGLSAYCSMTGQCQPLNCDDGYHAEDHQCVEDSGSCLTKSEACADKECGTAPDGCGGSYDCGSCDSNEYCSSGTCVCEPNTKSEACGNQDCGTASDGCGGSYDCGSCDSGEKCIYGYCEDKWCGDGTCDPDEDCNSCSEDCGCGSGATCTYFSALREYACVDDINCGDGTCDGDESADSCYTDCGSCGDGTCTDPPEDSSSCSIDCGPSCTSKDYKSCYNNDVYWYDSCGNRESKASECGTTSSWSSCSYDSTCDESGTKSRTVRGCSSSSCYSYTETDSCSRDTDGTSCGSGMTCQSGSCVDTTTPSVSVTGAPADWTSSEEIASVSCSDAETSCDSETYRLRVYDSDPGSCSTDYSSYDAEPQDITDHVWVCGAAQDTSGNTGYSDPTEFMIDQQQPTTTIKDITLKDDSNIHITVNDKEYGDSGFASCSYKAKNDDQKWDDTSWQSRSCPDGAFTVNTGTDANDDCNDTCQIRIRVTDNAGNSDMKTTVLNVDDYLTTASNSIRVRMDETLTDPLYLYNEKEKHDTYKVYVEPSMDQGSIWAKLQVDGFNQDYAKIDVGATSQRAIPIAYRGTMCLIQVCTGTVTFRAKSLETGKWAYTTVDVAVYRDQEVYGSAGIDYTYLILLALSGAIIVYRTRRHRE